MHSHDIHTLPSTYLCTSARQKRHMNKLYVFVSDVLVHHVKVRWTPWPPRCVFSWARCHEINWNPTKNIQRLPRYIVQCSKVVHLLCICGRNAWCLTRTCTYKQLFLPGWHMVVTNWKNKTSTSKFDQELPICAPCTPVLCGTGAKDYFMHGSPFLSAKDQLIDWCISTS